MATLDPSGFQMAVRVITTDGRKYPLFLTEASQSDALSTVDAALGIDGNSLLDGIPCVESVDIETSLGLTHKLTINLTAPYDTGIEIINSPILRIGNVIECQVGYPRIGRFMAPISAMATKPGVRITPDEGLTATINGAGGAFTALRNSRSSEYVNTTYASIIKRILGSHEYGLEVQLPDQNGPEDPLYVTRERTSQQNQSDWFFVQSMIRTAQCEAWIEPSRARSGKNVFVAARREEMFGGEPRFTFVMRGNADFDTVFPVFEFDTNDGSEGVWMPGAATSVRVGDINPDDLLAVEIVVRREESTVPATSPAIPAEGGGVVEDVSVRIVTTNDAQTSGENLYASARDPRGMANIAASHQTESAARSGGMNIKITTIGIPDLFPGTIVTLRHVGMFDGNYLVKSTTHRLAPGEWTMTLDLLNNASAQELLASVVAASPSRVNNATPPEPAADSSGGGTVVQPVPGT